VLARPMDMRVLANVQKEIELLGEERIVVLELQTKERECFDEGAAATVDAAGRTVDPARHLREGLVSLITRKTDMTVIGEASNGREAVDLWKQHHPDVTLLDLRMPELDGVGALKEIRENDEKARIIVLTTFDGDEDIYRAIQAGAKGYLLKDAPREALMDCIRRVHAGETCVPVHLAAKLAQRVSGETLSGREIEVLKLMAQGKSNKEIGSALFISEGTVKSHVKGIFAKMNVISRTEAVANATRRGLIQL
jgi:DNA-binding NarL/FixJ family response regulator